MNSLCRNLCQIGLSLLLSVIMLPAGAAPEARDYPVLQSRGVDQNVDYAALDKYAPWDDRNYNLTKSDLGYLSADEAQLKDPIPVFFRVELRKTFPHLRNKGPAQYPRAAVPMFYRKYTGLLRNGKYLGRDGAIRAVNAEGPLDQAADLGQVGNEFTVEINPVNPDIAIAGGNVGSGQGMYRSIDGGLTWDRVTILPNTCCDPSVDWSSDGTVAYATALSGSIGVSFWRSFDQGLTWVDRIDITPSGSDKEWIHVDRSPTSPYQDRMYITYHNGNTMQIARSLNGGNSFDVTSFGSAPSGIGSDITTDSAGNVYNFYGAFGAQTIEMLKSTDGGNTYLPAATVAATNASFDWPIPAMESRFAWIYAAADTDTSGGPFHDSIYVAWTDTTAAESGSAVNNHSVINVAYSRDGGASWTITNPHSMADTLTVDRFNQWLVVDENGNVHVVFYDTRNSLNRTGVDLYYAYSTDGAQTWSEPTRISSQTSDNIANGQEWGDYNGISVVGDKVVSVWTDNRNNTQLGFGAESLNEGSEPGFTLIADPTELPVCAPGSLEPVNISIGQILDFNESVTLGFDTLPAGFTGGFTVNPVTPSTPPATSVAYISVGAVAAGNYSFDITGTTVSSTKSSNLDVVVFDGAPAAPLLTEPADGVSLTGSNVTLVWNATAGAQSYLVEVATDAAFTNIVYSELVTNTSASVGGLATETTHYWRVRASNLCGDGVYSEISSFTTGLIVCSVGGTAIVDAPDTVTPGVTSLDIIIADGGILSDLDVSIQATHTWVGDLTFTLEHLDTGITAVMIDRPGVPASTFGCDANNIDVVLDDSAIDPVETACGSDPALGGTLQPQQPLAVFNGTPLAGTWRMTVIDNYPSDTGTFDEWCLLPQADSPDPDTDTDGWPDNDDNCTLVFNPGQVDVDSDGIGNLCDPDFDNNCVVNFDDLGLMKQGFFGSDPVLDLDSSGTVNFDDLGIMKAYFFGPPGPSAEGCN